MWLKYTSRRKPTRWVVGSPPPPPSNLIYVFVLPQNKTLTASWVQQYQALSCLLMAPSQGQWGSLEFQSPEKRDEDKPHPCMGQAWGTAQKQKDGASYQDNIKPCTLGRQIPNSWNTAKKKHGLATRNLGTSKFRVPGQTDRFSLTVMFEAKIWGKG